MVYHKVNGGRQQQQQQQTTTPHAAGKTHRNTRTHTHAQTPTHATDYLCLQWMNRFDDNVNDTTEEERRVGGATKVLV